MIIETDTTIRGGLPVTVTGVYKAAAAPLPMRGEAVAVVCPGWDEHVEDVEVFWPRKRHGQKLRPVPEFDHRNQPFVSESDLERCEEAILLAAREDWS